MPPAAANAMRNATPAANHNKIVVKMTAEQESFEIGLARMRVSEGTQHINVAARITSYTEVLRAQLQKSTALRSIALPEPDFPEISATPFEWLIGPNAPRRVTGTGLEGGNFTRTGCCR